jgi:hypothetical protein
MTKYVMLRNHIVCDGKLAVWVPMLTEAVTSVRTAKEASKICWKLRHITPITYVSFFLQVCKTLHDCMLCHSLAHNQVKNAGQIADS